MNPEIKTQWLEALRSGEYQQGHMALRNTSNQFCCLGVLCDLYAKAHPEESTDMLWSLKDTGTLYWFGGDDGIPPAKIREWAGLPSQNPVILVKTADEHIASSPCVNISDLNDNGMSFADIANYIEEQL